MKRPPNYVSACAAILMMALTTGCQDKNIYTQANDFDDFFKIEKAGDRENDNIREQLKLYASSAHRIKVSIAAALVDVENSSSYLERSPELDAMLARWLEVERWRYSRIRNGDTVCIEPSYVYHFEVFDKNGKSLGDIPTWWFYPVKGANRSVQVDLQQLPGFPRPQHRYVKQAQQGDARAQLQLGNDYMDDDLHGSVPMDVHKAVSWWRKAAAQGEAEAYTKLGLLYKAGNPKLAVSYLSRGAKLKSPLAQLELARCYREGVGVAPNSDETIAWYTLAHRNGSAKAAMELGEFYSNGELGMQPNKSLALHWFRTAAALGVPESLDAIETLRKS